MTGSGRTVATRAAATVAVLAVAAWAVVRVLAATDGDWVTAGAGQLRVHVELRGTLEAAERVLVGPPQVPEQWEYQIAWLGPEGSVIRRGQPVIRFDTSDLQRRLEKKVAERDQAASEIAKRAADEATRRSDATLKLAEARASQREAELQVEVPPELRSANDLAVARLEAELGRLSVAHLEDEAAAARRAAVAEMSILEETRRQAEVRVEEIRSAISAMQVAAPRDGTLILLSDWRDEKKKVGDSVWRGERIAEIDDLSVMMASGEVEEADAGRIGVGQRVTIRLDAHPDVEYVGRITELAQTVQRRSWRDPIKVMKLRIALDRTDPERMRPGMRFRGAAEVETIAAAVVVPASAVAVTAAGPVVVKRTLTGAEVVRVEVGRRGDDGVEIVSGIAVGDRVARVAEERREVRP